MWRTKWAVCAAAVLVAAVVSGGSPVSAATNDFAIGAHPASLSVVQGASGVSYIVTYTTSGTAQSISLSATGLPAGASASFNPATVVAGRTSTMTVTTSGSTPPGTSAITITGTGTSVTHTTPLSLTVKSNGTNDFSIGANPSSITVAKGSSGTSTISTAVTNGSAQSVSLSASGLPAGASASFNPSSVTAGRSSTLTITTSAATPAGTSTVTVTGTGMSVTHSTSLSLTVTSVTGNDFSISANPGTVTVNPGGSGTSTISTAVTSGSAQSVSLSASGLPSGATASFNPTSVTAGGSSTLTITTAGSTPTGTSTVTVTGTGASATHTTTVSLTVTAPQTSLLQVSSDPFTNSTSQHATQVEPDTLSNGSTIVSAFQSGRFTDGGSSDLGWATSTDAGKTWSHGFLPGITTFQGGGTWARVSDPSVAYDAKHGVWLITGLVLDASATGRGVSVSRSTDGLNWTNPVISASTTQYYFDKDWIVCDRTSTSASYGHCYIEFDNNSLGNQVLMQTSSDGGLTWSTPVQTADSARGLGGQPLVQPNGTVVVPYFADGAGQIRSFLSTNGGTSWNSSVLVSSVSTHRPAGGLRTMPLPTAEIDGAGKVYVAWHDCKFRTGCPSNDIVLSTSTNGSAWTTVQRIPIDAVGSTVDHFIPGLAVDAGTSGASGHLGLYYYSYPTSACSSTTCQLEVGFVSSADGGNTWSTPTQVAGPMSLSLLPSTTEGLMVGDYISASFVGGKAYAPVAVALAPSGGVAYNEAMYVVPGGLGGGGQTPAEVFTGGSPVSPSQQTGPALTAN